MVALSTEREVPAPPSTPRSYLIQLKVSAADREDAWDLCRVAMHYGGREVRDCCFVFSDKERWLGAAEALRFRFGPEYFEAVE